MAMIEALTADDLACSATLVRSPAGMLEVLSDSPPLEARVRAGWPTRAG
ncbi:hypothetical protein ABIC99_000200 [Sphaerotilus sulfidivorans]|jgi:hypothetical protein|uniref:GNAT family N-acetyltransferase n=1 Tax=Sphaerotilus sulfidivorans TaxID=639200 RepID=A0ABV2IIH8_9BURK|nr:MULTISPECIES: hypothetical protein [Sphaerotilus]NZD44643.1 hypothetical protein [Sphaerotilus sulfidivorans]